MSLKDNSFKRLPSIELGFQLVLRINIANWSLIRAGSCGISPAASRFAILSAVYLRVTMDAARGFRNSYKLSFASA
jgi:hypothetical protein